ncbi:MAG TPA: UDP-N-acetylmuramoyl-tripeptide--D-alanyl-D-alanine ligase [Fastidiosipila sp.]|nr:UDP-N-acetylmuramoyl-tripeptide--D-alanyl-D-alanine ligase [Fastidiosipila sp.]
MSRFIPVQLKNWTNGQLFQTGVNASDVERHYVGVSKDTRTIKPNEVYVALIGPNFDGHDFVDAALSSGATMLVLKADHKMAKKMIKRLEKEPVNFDLLLVDDTLKAFQDIAHGYRQSLAASVIGVTGSFGKTTTRRMIHSILAPQMQAMETFANLNNEIGLSETLLNAQPEDQVLVTELAMDRRGEIQTLSAIAKPDVAIITGIGHSHAQFLGSLRAILEEKTSIIDSMKDNALCIVNGDNKMLEAWAITKERDLSVWFVASEQNTGRLERDGFPVFWAEEIKLEKNGTHFVARSSFDSSHRWPMYIPEPGKHLISAALFGLATAYALGLNMERAAAAAAQFENTGDRQRIIERDGLTLINDTYNASPESMYAAFDVLNLLSEGRRSLAVIGGMRELGKYSEAEHVELAKYILANPPEKVFVTGEEALPTYRYLSEHMAQDQVVYENDLERLISKVRSTVKRDDIVLFKASRYHQVEKVANALLESWPV